jgi:DNA-binding transcriptional ArsR family regulator
LGVEGVEDPVDYYSKKVFIGGHGPITKAATVLDSRARQAIVYLLGVYGPLTLKEISEKLKLSPSTVHDHLKKLKEVGVIKEAEEHPKKFKVEIYYRLNIPYLLFSELSKLEDSLKDLINAFSEFIEKAKNNIISNIKNADLRCLRYKEPSMYERVALVLLIQLSILILNKYINESLTYVLINDLEESKPTNP